MPKYVFNPDDGSWFGIENAVIIDVPEDVGDADDVEEHLQYSAAHNSDLIQLKDLVSD